MRDVHPPVFVIVAEPHGFSKHLPIGSEPEIIYGFNRQFPFFPAGLMRLAFKFIHYNLPEGRGKNIFNFAAEKRHFLFRRRGRVFQCVEHEHLAENRSGFAKHKRSA